MMKLPAGDKVLDLIELAYRANQPILLAGRHGVGKSSLFEAAANRAGIGVTVRDLSLMEPVDLMGIPHVDDQGRTVYRPPQFLPTEGKGLLVFEELNRSPRYMQVPCLQLLTARRLNDYVLPPGWLPCAAINAGEEYFVGEMDVALTSRFLQVQVEADRSAWLEWARRSGVVHEAVVDFIASTPDVFDDPQANPRAWTYASNLLIAWEAGSIDKDMDKDQLAVALAGVLGDKWTAAFLEFYGVGAPRPLSAPQVIADYPRHRPRLLRWVSRSKRDVLAASLRNLQAYLQRQRDYDIVAADATAKRHVEQFFFDLPAELRKSVRQWLKDRGFDRLKVPRKARI